jgi:hypothetical protein
MKTRRRRKKKRKVKKVLKNLQLIFYHVVDELQYYKIKQELIIIKNKRENNIKKI